MPRAICKTIADSGFLAGQANVLAAIATDVGERALVSNPAWKGIMDRECELAEDIEKLIKELIGEEY